MMTRFTSLSAPSPMDRPDPQRQVLAAIEGHGLGWVVLVFYKPSVRTRGWHGSHGCGLTQETTVSLKLRWSVVETEIPDNSRKPTGGNRVCEPSTGRRGNWEGPALPLVPNPGRGVKTEVKLNFCFVSTVIPSWMLAAAPQLHSVCVDHVSAAEVGRESVPAGWSLSRRLERWGGELLPVPGWVGGLLLEWVTDRPEAWCVSSLQAHWVFVYNCERQSLAMQ